MYLYDFLVASICLLGLMNFVSIPIEVLLACTIVYLYGKMFVASNA